MGSILKDLLAVARTQVLGGQISKSSPRKKVLVYTTNCIRRMNDYDLTPDDVEDVFWKGTRLKGNALVRQLNGYEIGLYYFVVHGELARSVPVSGSILTNTTKPPSPFRSEYQKGNTYVWSSQQT